MYDYSSTHIVLPKYLADEIMSWCSRNIVGEDLYLGPDGSFGRENNPHVTVLCGLHTSSPLDVAPLIAGFPKVIIQLGLVSIFTTNELYDVLKIDVVSESLKYLNKRLKRLGHTCFFPSYKPHATIAYVKKNSANHLIGDRTFENKFWMADSVVFSSKRAHQTRIPFTCAEVTACC